METMFENILAFMFVSAIVWLILERFVFAFSDQPTYRQRLTERALSRPTEEILAEVDRQPEAEEDDFQYTYLNGWSSLPEKIRITLTDPQYREVLHRLPKNFFELSEKEMYLEIITIAGEMKREERAAWKVEREKTKSIPWKEFERK